MSEQREGRQRFAADDRPARFRWVDMTDDMRKSLLDWVVDTCLLFGTERKTAFLVAATFAEGLDREALP